MRSRSRLIVAVACMVFSTEAICTDNQDLIDYRQHIMKTMGEEAAAISQILQKKIPPDALAAHVEVLAIAAATAKAAFEPKASGGKAKDDVWAQWPDFAARLDKLAASTAELAKVAKAGGMNAVAPQVANALTCKGCHDTYRTPD